MKPRAILVKPAKFNLNYLKLVTVSNMLAVSFRMKRSGFPPFKPKLMYFNVLKIRTITVKMPDRSGTHDI
jgi:hypothetical protein